MKLLFLVLLLLFFLKSIGQTSEVIDIKNFNYQYLEHLVKKGVDEVRSKYNAEPLINDSILYVASSYHATYLVGFGKLSHIEVDSILTKSPQNRVDYFGAKNYRVGENILFTPYNKMVKGRDGKIYDTHYYQDLANAMIVAWVNSPGHFKNMIEPNYQLTGLSIAIDTNMGRAYACQKFAIADFKYSFSENKSMFPYSNYVEPVIANSFRGVKRELIDNYKYDYMLRHDKPDNCTTCDSIVKHTPFLTLRVERNKFILRVEDADYIKNLTSKRQDGFAVEIVSFNDYLCGNPAYYVKPSRRNDQLALNGKILKPVYKKDLQNGFRKRKRRKDVKFISYIFKSDSLKFFNRFKRYKVDRYNYKYFEISLGRVPRDLDGYWAHNLVYIQNQQICHIDYFTAYCGDVVKEFQPARFIPPSAEDNCVLYPEDQSLSFSIPFEQGKSEFTAIDIDPFITSISDLSYQIDSVYIHAYSSIEGDSTINTKLQQLRAKNIVEVLKKNQREEVPVRIKTTTDWNGFYQEVSIVPKWSYLANLSKSEISTELNKVDVKNLEPILEKARRGQVKLYCTINVNDQNISYFINKELNAVNSRIDTAIANNFSTNTAINDFSKLYECIHSKVIQGKLSSEFLAAIKMPLGFKHNHPLLQNFIIYGYEFPEAFASNEEWVMNHKSHEDFIESTCTAPDHQIPEFFYIRIRNAAKVCQEQGTGDFEQLQNLLNMLDEMQEFYLGDSVAQVNIDRLNFNLNTLLLNYVFAEEPLKYAGNAIKSIAQLHQFYEKYGLMTGNKAIKLGRTAVHFQQINTAYALMNPFVEEDSVLAYMLPMGYQHISSENAVKWYQKVIAKSESMNAEIWCNMFFGQCEIPFQALDYEPLREVFCRECLQKNDLIIDLLGTEPSKP